MSTWNKHYHWKTKGCTPWAKEWFTEKLVGKSASIPGEKDTSVSVERLSKFDGDVELGNRKGKLITIYDCSVTLNWTGASPDGDEVRGTITFPEVSHEIEDNGENYRFETELSTGSSDAARTMYQTVRQTLAPELEKVLHDFRTNLIETHAKDLGHDDTSSSTAAPSSGAAGAAATPAASSAPSKPKDEAVSTSSAALRATAQLAISQADLWDLLTNPARIPMWSKAPAQLWLNPGANFSLFGGNITGSVVSVDAPRKLVQSWRVPQWPTNHYGTLTTELTQSEDSTKLELVLTGVPTGQEDTTQAGLENYYIRGLKSIGLGTLL
ncbi:AHA1 [Malassezia furfur]|nr:AHA1 [Malassezia furfur]